jgi:hypothetical protein
MPFTDGILTPSIQDQPSPRPILDECVSAILGVLCAGWIAREFGCEFCEDFLLMALDFVSKAASLAQVENTRKGMKAHGQKRVSVLKCLHFGFIDP